jgi:hypothetical protein
MTVERTMSQTRCPGEFGDARLIEAAAANPSGSRLGNGIAIA